MGVECTVPSPCVSLCTLDDSDICVGCHRSVDEIVRWRQMDDDERRGVLLLAQERSHHYKPFTSG